MIKVRNRPGTPSAGSGAIAKLKHWLYRFRPRFRSGHFWAVQAMVISIAIAHAFFENMGYFSQLGRLYFIPISLFFVPIVYAALNFGLAGAVSTALSVIVVSLPNLVIWHGGAERLGEVFQMGVLVAVAAFLGHRVDRETGARSRAEAASAALKTYSAYIVSAQEEERQRIARELHDETIQTLSLLCRKLDRAEAISESTPAPVIKELREARKTTEEVVKGLRDFARSLRPPTLDDLGIVPSIRRLLADFSERTGIDGHLDINGQERRLNRDTELGLFRIAQEALRNVEYHSRATGVTMTITFADREAGLQVTDNGIGFKERSQSRQLGLLGMRERAELLGGKLDIYSSPGKGATILASIPAPPAG